MGKPSDVEQAVDRQHAIRWRLFVETVASKRPVTPLRAAMVVAEALEWLASVGVAVSIKTEPESGRTCVRLANGRGHTMASANASAAEAFSPPALYVLLALQKLLAYGEKYRDVQTYDDGSLVEASDFLTDLRRVDQSWTAIQSVYAHEEG